MIKSARSSPTRRRPQGVSTAALATLFVVPALAAAQDVAPVPAAARQGDPSVEATSGALEEIVVTAQKRAESLQDVPVSVTALTADELDDMKLDNATMIAERVPNLRVNGIIGGPSPVFSLRGVSMFDYSLNQSSPVATYVDEVYKGNFALFGVELFDLERVEVLRGPQGTLYGKNTTGGAINFISRTPSFDSTDRYLKLGVGNYNRYEVDGGFGGTLVADRVAARIAFTYAKADGWFKNLLPGGPDMDAVDQWAARGSLLFRPSDSLDLLLRYSHSDQSAYNYAIFARPGPNGIGAGVFEQYHQLDPISNPNTDYFREGLADDEVEVSFTPKREQTTDTVSLTANVAVSSALTLTSISAYSRRGSFQPGSNGWRTDRSIQDPVCGSRRAVHPGSESYLGE